MALVNRNKKKKESIAHFSKEDQRKILCADSPFVVKEAYSSIRTNLLFSQKGEDCPIFVVTSPTANNGKSINSVNMAISFAQMGKKTLLIDGDMRNPTLHRLFSIPVKNGLSEILAGLTDSITVSKTDVENLSILTAGKIPPNPSELLSNERTDKLLSFVKQHYDCVFIDTPPVNLVTDPTAFATKSTGYIMIIKAGITDTPNTKKAVETLTSLGANIVGFVLNDVVESGAMKYYSYGKYRGYKYKSKYGYNYNYNYKYR